VEDLLALSINEDRANRYLDEFSARHPDILETLRQDPERLERLLTIFNFSRFLSEELLRRPDWILAVNDVHRPFSASDYKQRLASFLDERRATTPAALDFALFRRRELLRLIIRDAQALGTLSELTQEISNLADTILTSALDTVTNEVAKRHGSPQFNDGSGAIEGSGFCVVALGKLGGSELNYSSDLDLMFLYPGNGETSGPEKITNKEFFKKIANQLTTLLSTYTPGGLCYRIDLRLRPEGSLGDVCMSVAGLKDYYARRARDWELQMLIKARVAAGDRALGQEFLDFVEPLIYSTTIDFSAIETMSGTRERITEKLGRKRSSDALDIKLAPGGIRDIEFLVQCLQRLHGGRESWVRHGGTLLALSRLLDKDLLSGTEYSRLADAYRFLRRLEHRLQFEDDRQTHSLPRDPDELERIARRMPASGAEGNQKMTSKADLLIALNGHLENVQNIYERIVHAQRPLSYTASAAPISFVSGDASATMPVEHIGEMAPANGSLPGIAEKSAFFAEELRRHPELISEIGAMQPHGTRRPALEALSAPLSDIGALARCFRCEMFRIQWTSVFVPEPVFQTLDQTSALAEFIIARAYRIALERALTHARSHSTPAKPFQEPQADMMVVALGRLGMREFDLASDADLTFIIPESEAERHRFWIRVAEHTIEILTGYTAEPPMLSIDTRLRPNGREGMLVQTESKYYDYFEKSAEAWEGIAYMKARGVAGDLEGAKAFLRKLQDVDWRRYGQGRRSKQDLRQMRARLQREQGTQTPLKAAEGGYYDADFILMYLRLKGAGMFFTKLNTPERIEVVEQMGHLERSDAEFMLRATTFFRALDHGLRVLTGRAEQKLPEAEAEREMLAALGNRWTSEHLTAANLEERVHAQQAKMRRLFERVFS